MWILVVVVGGVEKGEVAKNRVLIFFKEIRSHREGERAIRAREGVAKSMNDSNGVVVRIREEKVSVVVPSHAHRTIEISPRNGAIEETRGEFSRTGECRHHTCFVIKKSNALV